jgi:hypothetical protein
MKAKVIREPYRMANLQIGEVVEIIPGMETDAEGIWNAPAGKLVLCKKEDGTFTYGSMLDLEIVEYDTVDWSSFRREAAKDILCAMIQAGVDDAWRNVVPAAIEGADELIKQLREGEK